MLSLSPHTLYLSTLGALSLTPLSPHTHTHTTPLSHPTVSPHTHTHTVSLYTHTHTFTTHTHSLSLALSPLAPPLSHPHSHPLSQKTATQGKKEFNSLDRQKERFTFLFQDKTLNCNVETALLQVGAGERNVHGASKRFPKGSAH